MAGHSGVPVDDWDRAARYLADALDGSYTLDDVRDEIASGRAQLWHLQRGAVVTQVHEYPRKRVLRVWLAGGDLDELQRRLPSLDQVARDYRCSVVEIEGRKGWERVLSGYEADRVILRKEL